MKKIFITTTQEQQCKNEISILKKINHPNIIKYYESLIQKNKLYLILEYAEDGDLRTVISKHKKASKTLEENVIFDYFYQIADSIEYIHEKKIIHRDIKPENIFISKGIIKLGDFGISKELSGTCELAKSGVGTPYYVSPEICRGELYDLKTDIWSLGCLLYELCSFQRPFVSKNINALMINITKNEPKPLDNTLYSNKLIALINIMMNKDPEKRPDIKKIKESLNEIMGKVLFKKRKIEILKELEINSPKGLLFIKDDNCKHVSFQQLTLQQEETKQQHTQPQPQPSPSSLTQDDKIISNVKYHSKLFSEKIIGKKSNDKTVIKPTITINNIDLVQLSKDTNSSQHSSNTTLTTSMQSPLPEANGFIFSAKSISNPEIKQSIHIKNNSIDNRDSIDNNKFHLRIKKRCNSKSVNKKEDIIKIVKASTLTGNKSNQNNKEHRNQLMNDFLLNKFGSKKLEQLLALIKENNVKEYEHKIISLIGEDEYKKSIKYLKFITEH